MKKPSLPFKKKEIWAILRDLKKDIADDYRASEEDEVPSMQVTFAADRENMVIQTGDNSFSGPAYHYPHWSVISLYRDSNCDDLADEVYNELKDLLYEDHERTV